MGALFFWKDPEKGIDYGKDIGTMTWEEACQAGKEMKEEDCEGMPVVI